MKTRLSFAEVEERLDDKGSGIEVSFTGVKGLCFLLGIPPADNLEYYTDYRTMEFVFNSKK